MPYELDITRSRAIATECFVAFYDSGEERKPVCIVFADSIDEALSIYPTLYVSSHSEYTDVSELSFMPLSEFVPGGKELAFVTDESPLKDITATSFSQGVYDFDKDGDGWHYQRQRPESTDTLISKYYLYVIVKSKDTEFQSLRDALFADNEDEAMSLYLASDFASSVGDASIEGLTAVNADDFLIDETGSVPEFLFLECGDVISNISINQYKNAIQSFSRGIHDYRRQSYTWIKERNDVIGSECFIILRTDGLEGKSEIIRTFEIAENAESAIALYKGSESSQSVNDSFIPDGEDAPSFMDGVVIEAVQIDEYLNGKKPDTLELDSNDISISLEYSDNKVSRICHYESEYIKGPDGWTYSENEIEKSICYIIKDDDLIPYGFEMSCYGPDEAVKSFSEKHPDTNGLSAMTIDEFVPISGVKVTRTDDDSDNDPCMNSIPFSTDERYIDNLQTDKDGKWYFTSGSDSYGPLDRLFIIERIDKKGARGFSVKQTSDEAISDYMSRDTSSKAGDKDASLLKAIDIDAYLEAHGDIAVIGRMTFNDGTFIYNIMLDDAGIYSFQYGNKEYTFTVNGFYESPSGILGDQCYIIVRHFKPSSEAQKPYAGDYARNFVFANSKFEAYEQYLRSGFCLDFEDKDENGNLINCDYQTQLDPIPIDIYAKTHTITDDSGNQSIMFDDFRQWLQDGSADSSDKVSRNYQTGISNLHFEDSSVVSFTHSCYDYTLTEDGWTFAPNGKPSTGSEESIPDNIAGKEAFIISKEVDGKPVNLTVAFGDDATDALARYHEIDGFDPEAKALWIDDYVMKYRMRSREIPIQNDEPITDVTYDSETVYYFKYDGLEFDKGHYGWLSYDIDD